MMGQRAKISHVVYTLLRRNPLEEFRSRFLRITRMRSLRVGCFFKITPANLEGSMSQIVTVVDTVALRDK